MIALGALSAWALWIGIALTCLAGSFLFSGLETGVYVMNKIRLDLRAEGGDSAARRLHRLLRNYSNFLAVILIGNNVVNYTLTLAVTGMFMLAGLADRAEWYTLVVVTPLLFVLCESLPKNVFQRSGDRLVYRYAWLLGLSSLAFNALGVAQLVRGFSWLMSRLSGMSRKHYSPLAHESLPAAVAEGQASGVLTHFQSIMADRVMHLADLRMHDVMTPMRQVVSIPPDALAEQIRDTARAEVFSRLPVREANGQIRGIVDIHQVLLSPDRPLAEQTQPALVLPDDMDIIEALYRMRRQRVAMAVVGDRAGRHIGIATLKDLLEEIVGELDAW